MASDKIEDPSVYAGPPTKIITVGSIAHTHFESDYDIEGNKIKGTERQVYVYGSEVRLYTTRFRKRDGARILTKIGYIEKYEFIYDPNESKKQRRRRHKQNLTKYQATKLAVGLAKKYDWLFFKKAAHNDLVSDSLQAYLELEELERRGTSA